MLQGMTWASPPAFLMPSATSWQASALRLETTTFAPSLASSSAEERPMPRLEPVMTATFPVRSNGVFFIVVGSLLSSPSLRGAKRRSNPCLNLRRYGLLRYAHNDGGDVNVARMSEATSGAVLEWSRMSLCSSGLRLRRTPYTS